MFKSIISFMFLFKVLILSITERITYDSGWNEARSKKEVTT